RTADAFRTTQCPVAVARGEPRFAIRDACDAIDRDPHESRAVARSRRLDSALRSGVGRSLLGPAGTRPAGSPLLGPTMFPRSQRLAMWHGSGAGRSAEG